MSQALHWPRLGLWQWIFWLLLLGGIAAGSALRFGGLHGAVRSGDLKGPSPWGLCLGLNIFCGIALAAGGFAVAAGAGFLAHFHLRTDRLLQRPSLLVGAAGYFVALLTLLILPAGPAGASGDLLSWTRGVLVSGVTCAVAVCLAALAVLGFSRRTGDYLAPPSGKFLRVVNLLLVLLAAFLAGLQQNALLQPMLKSPAGFSPLWVTPLLPLLFLFSGLIACLAVILFAASHPMRHSGARCPVPHLFGLTGTLCLLLIAYLCLRLLDFSQRGIFPLLWGPGLEVSLLGVEFSLFLLPLLLLAWRRQLATPRLLYASSAMIVAGFLTNRLNTAITSAEAAAGRSHLPGWTEVLFAFSVIALGVAGFIFIAKQLPEWAALTQAPHQSWETLLPPRDDRYAPRELWEAFLPRSYRKVRRDYEDQANR